MVTVLAGLPACIDVEYRESEGGPFVDPPDARFDVVNPYGVVVVSDEPTTIVVSPGRHRGCYDSQPFDAIGVWQMVFKATIDGQPATQTCTFELVPGPSPTQTCEAWPFDPDCCSLPDGDHDELILKMRARATDLLWAAGGRIHGPCPVTVRPCLRRCVETFSSHAFGSQMTPYIGTDGLWRNSCGCHSDCSCDTLCEVVLEGPVAGIIEVLADEAYGGDPVTRVIPPDTYRLDVVGEQTRLVRTNGQCFPPCQQMSANDNEEGSFVVRYQKGLPYTELQIAAHSELVCEMAKSCIPSCKTCRLPVNVASKVRSGVSITFDNTQSWIRSLPLVDAWLDTVNPNGLQKPLRVASPDSRGGHRRAH